MGDYFWWILLFFGVRFYQFYDIFYITWEFFLYKILFIFIFSQLNYGAHNKIFTNKFEETAVAIKIESDLKSHQEGNLLGLQDTDKDDDNDDKRLINKASFLKYCINANFMAIHYSHLNEGNISVRNRMIPFLSWLYMRWCDAGSGEEVWKSRRGEWKWRADKAWKIFP